MEIEQLLVQSLSEMGIALTEHQIQQFMTYQQLLLEWNQKMNLTAITEPKEVVIKHFVDSASILTKIKVENRMKIIDIGTGAGFPGIPLKILCPDIQITLVDSTNKRILFLEEVIRTLGLTGVSCLHARAEELGKDKQYRERFHYCVSRAVANLRVLSELCIPFVRVGGAFVSLKGPDVSEEVNDAKDMIKRLGAKVAEVQQMTLPNSDITHTFVLISKLQQTPTGYPRIMSKISKKSSN